MRNHDAIGVSLAIRANGKRKLNQKTIAAATEELSQYFSEDAQACVKLLRNLYL